MVMMSRRNFLDVAGAAALAGLATRRVSAASSERVRHALIGTGGRGRAHAQHFSSFDDCEIVAVCDVDPQRRNIFAERLPNSEGVVVHEDYRRVLDDPDIDTVSIATPDHWHTIIAVAALNAGKHVYVEKPGSHNIREARLLAKGAASGKCVQFGAQGRSSNSFREAVAFMRDGGLGKIRMAKAINHQHRKPIGREPDTDPPEGVNYDLWLGPAPRRSFSQNRWHYNWHWFWDYGNGDIANDGIHQIDQARWGLGVGLPNAVVASGGQLYYDDDHETPDTQTVVYEYDDCQLLYEMRLWTDYKLEGHDNGVIFYGDKGRMEFGRGGATAIFIDGEEKFFGHDSDVASHIRNFLDCAKADTPEALQGCIAEGSTSAMLCHLGNIATRVGRKLHIDPKTGDCKNDAEAAAMYAREYREGYELPELA